MVSDAYTELNQRFERFLDDLIDAIGLERLHQTSRASRPGASVDEGMVASVEQMRTALDLLAAMLPTGYLEQVARQEPGRQTRDGILIKALAPIVAVWRADVWEKRQH